MKSVKQKPFYKVGNAPIKFNPPEGGGGTGVDRWELRLSKEVKKKIPVIGEWYPCYILTGRGSSYRGMGFLLYSHRKNWHVKHQETN